MGMSQNFPSFSCEVRIIQAQNVEFNSSGKGNLFARFYLSAGTNKRIQLNTRKISSKFAPFWDESFSLDCSCTQQFLDNLKQENLVLELRQSNTVPILGKICGSRVLGRAAIPWKSVLESPKMELKEWVKMMDLESGSVIKPLKLQMEIKIGVPSERNRSMRLKNWDECGCKDGHKHGCCDHDYELFALAAAFEAF
ncbi:putative C2 domain-containing protein [Senna tora]|uniref:Putative C2 domain-containing protein n=1 Tax=Senna tora TaxID=362788 RepID=A0A834WXK3_9FABA|nr:putative C2 domain-containing protein [Senna tora]